jgi:nucleoid-associated protein YgaU
LRGEDRADVPAGYRLDEVDSAAVIGALEGLLRTHPPAAASRAARVAQGLSQVDHLAGKAETAKAEASRAGPPKVA